MDILLTLVYLKLVENVEDSTVVITVSIVQSNQQKANVAIKEDVVVELVEEEVVDAMAEVEEIVEDVEISTMIIMMEIIEIIQEIKVRGNESLRQNRLNQQMVKRC